MRRKIKKKFYILPIYILFCVIGTTYGQISEGENYYSAPSASSFTNYVNTPVSVSYGIPDISIPFFTLPTHNKDISVNTGISYHPNNTGNFAKATDVGEGWSLSGIHGVVYRSSAYVPNSQAENFYYSFLGRSGKFTLIKDTSGDIKLKRWDNFKLAIDYTINNGFYNFIITDELGNNYYFDILDQSYFKSGNINTEGNYVSAFYLSKVTSVKNVNLLLYEYIEDSYNITGSDLYPKNLKSLKLSKVISPDYGSINLNYTFNAYLRNKHSDPYNLNSIELKLLNGKPVKKFGFEQNVSSLHKRDLKKVLSYDIDNNFVEYVINKSNSFYISPWTEPFCDITFDYEGIYMDYYEGKNPKNLANRMTIKFPTGGTTEYIFEPNQYYVDKSNFNSPQMIFDRDAQFFEDVAVINFDFTANGTGLNSGFFNVPYNDDNVFGESYLVSCIYIDELYPLQSGPPYTTIPGYDPDNPPNPYVAVKYPNAGSTNSIGYTYFSSGTHPYQLEGTGGKGKIVIKRVKNKSNPLPNYSTDYSLRVSKINYYNGNVIFPDISKNYDYSYFDNAAQPSGYKIFVNNDEINQTRSIVYKNIKETIGAGEGFTKYYYKTLDDYPENLDSNGNLNMNNLKYVNLLQNGLMYKKEVYDKDNILVNKIENDFEFYELGSNYTSAPAYTSYANAIIKKNTTVSTSYSPSGSFKQTSETTRDINDYNVIYKKNIGTDGNMTEEFTTYPYQYQSTDPNLWNARIKDVPLITETKINGVMVSKSETKFENSNHFLPTGSVSYLPDNPNQPIKHISNDIYDDRGNLVQFTNFPEVGNIGNSTTVIWGYHKTVPIAKIEGAKLSDIPAALITAIINASNADADAVTPAQEASAENALVVALNNFRTNTALQDFMITCYTYNPLIGVTKIIPPTGMMEIYNYDSYNRLLNIQDVNGKVLKAYEYNYKQ